MRLIKDKKGILGLETVQAVIIALLVLAVIAVATFLALDSLVGTGKVLSSTALVSNIPFGNETINLTDTPTQPASVIGFVGVTYTSLFVTNATDGVEITSANFTVDSNGAFVTAVGGSFNATNVNISSGAWTNTKTSDGQNLVNNVTNGTAQFFANIPTVMIILGAVVIILAVVLIILAVGRISGGAAAAEFSGSSSPGPGL